MISTYDKTTHLSEVTVPDNRKFYLVVVNTFTHPKSIKENSYFEVCQLAEVQMHLITKHYIEIVLKIPFWRVKEIAVMSEPPFGDVLYTSKSVKGVEVLVVRDQNGMPVIAGGISESDFIEEIILDDDELYGQYSDSREEIRGLPVERYSAIYIPTTAYRDVFDMDRYFNRYTRYDYDKEVWVTPL